VLALAVLVDASNELRHSCYKGAIVVQVCSVVFDDSLFSASNPEKNAWQKKVAKARHRVHVKHTFTRM
jgi:hypothetical protein